MKQLWPKYEKGGWDATDVEYAMYWKWFCDYDVKTITKLLLSVAGECDFKPLRKVIRAKMGLLPKPHRETSHGYVEVFFVCVETDGQGKGYAAGWYAYPGSLITLCYPATMQEDEIRYAMQRQSERWTVEDGFGICRWDFFVGAANLPLARTRAKEVFTVAFDAKLLPDRFYVKHKATMKTYTQPAPLPDFVPIAVKPLEDGEIPYALTTEDTTDYSDPGYNEEEIFQNPF